MISGLKIPKQMVDFHQDAENDELDLVEGSTPVGAGILERNVVEG
jgi:hypothetical protein